MLYQRKQLPDTNIGDPGPLPPYLAGMADASLADLSKSLSDYACDAFGYAGQGFFPVAPDPVLLSQYDFLRLFTPEERMAIRQTAVVSPAVADWLDLLNRVSEVHLDDPTTIAGVEALEGVGLLSVGRAAQILANQAP